MRYYLFSYKFGDCLDQLTALLPTGARIGHIHNARDFTTADVAQRVRSQEEELTQLQQLGFAAEVLDLKTYFHQEAALRTTLQGLQVTSSH